MTTLTETEPIQLITEEDFKNEIESFLYPFNELKRMSQTEKFTGMMKCFKSKSHLHSMNVVGNKMQLMRQCGFDATFEEWINYYVNNFKSWEQIYYCMRDTFLFMRREKEFHDITKSQAIVLWWITVIYYPYIGAAAEREAMRLLKTKYSDYSFRYSTAKEDVIDRVDIWGYDKFGNLVGAYQVKSALYWGDNDAKALDDKRKDKAAYNRIYNNYNVVPEYVINQDALNGKLTTRKAML